MNTFMKKTSILSLALAVTLGLAGCGSTEDTATSSEGSNLNIDHDSPNFKTQDMAELYIATYNKPPTYTIITELMDYHSLREAARTMKPNRALYPSNQSYANFVETLFQTVYGRASQKEEKEMWIKKINDGEILKKDMWMEFEDAAVGDDRKVMDNKIEVSKYYADKGKGEDYNLIHISKEPSSVRAAEREIDLLKTEKELFPEANYNLTAGEDHIMGTGGFDVIEGKVGAGGYQTLETIDGIDGGGGNDILRATIVSDAAPTIKNIEEVQVRFAGDDDKAIFDLINSSDILTLNAMLSTQKGTVDHIYGISQFKISSTQHDITLDGGKATRTTLETTGVGSPQTEVTADFKANQVNHINIKSVSSYFKYDQSDGGSTLKSAGIDLKGDNIIRLEAGKDSIEKIILSNDGSINLAPGNGSMMDQFMLKKLQKLEADINVGDIKVYVDNSDAATLGYVKTSAGVDEVFIFSGGGDSKKEGKALRENLKINLGAGDDMMIIMAKNANKIPSTIRIDAQGGMENKLAFNSEVATTLEDGKQENGFDDFQVFIVIDELDGTVDMNYMDDMQIFVFADKYKDTSIVAGLESGAFITFTTDIDDDDGDTTVTVKGDTTVDGTTDLYNLNFKADNDTDFGNIVVDYIENLNFMTNDGGMKKAAIIAGSAQNINVTGNAILDIYEKPIKSVSKVTAGDAGIKVNISGDGNVKQVVNTGAGKDKIALGDGDGENQNICNVGRGSDEVTGGAGADSIDLDSGDDILNSSGGLDTITLGTGRDIYVAQSVRDSQGTHVDVIVDFVSKEDIFDFRKVVKAALGDDAKGNYLGEAEGYAAALSTLNKDNQTAEAVLDTDKNKLYIDVNSDGDISDEDMVINLSKNQVNKLDKGDFIFAD